MSKIRIFEIGGHVRDSLLGIKSKDIDCAVEAPSFEAMHEFVEQHTKKIFLVKEEFLTIRALGHDGLAKDFVLCRKDGDYSDGRRPDSVEPGTIFDDLARRDFTINAMAINVATGEFLDPFNGREDLDNRVIRCVGEASERFEEDSLRILRAIRFCITKGFRWDEQIDRVLREDGDFWAAKLQNISQERIREELGKCFKFNTTLTLKTLSVINPAFIEIIFDDNGTQRPIWLRPTMEKK